jgi:hypothetical protein
MCARKRGAERLDPVSPVAPTRSVTRCFQRAFVERQRLRPGGKGRTR